MYTSQVSIDKGYGRDTAAIGIDLGTTNTCVAVVKNGKVEIIANSLGKRTTPSFVCFSDEGILVGEPAKNVSHMYLKSSICEIKRIMGSKFSDKTTQEQIKKFPFDVVDNCGNPNIRVEHKSGVKEYHPEQISAEILKHSKEIAKSYLGFPVTRAVITIPAYFDIAQRQATKDSAEIAGLKVIGLITEPTAAAIAYGWENKSYVRRTILLFDLGGGTFDVSIVNIDENEYEVKATAGDTHLGGSDFDTNIVDFFVQQFQEKHGKGLKDDKSAMRRLRSKCEEMKERLSNSFKESIDLPSLHDGKDLESTISRIEFERVNYSLFQRTIDLVAKCLEDVKLKKSDITDIVLVGGSTRIPKIQEMLKDFFDSKKLMKSINPDEAVAYGAAIKAAWLCGDKSDVPVDFKISEVTPLSLGIEIYTGKFYTFIKRNTPIPCEVKDSTLATPTDNCTAISTYIYEGERLLAKDNSLLGEFVISNLPPKPAGAVKFTYTCKLDYDGILHMDAVTQETGQTGNIKIKLNKNRLSQKELQRILREAGDSKEEDEKKVRLVEAEYKLESYCLSTKDKAARISSDLGSAKLGEIINACDTALEKMKLLKEYEAIDELLKQTKKICDPLFK